jgi:serine/threonine protein kinase/tetratricopeptide (TPR) repeat protein
MELAPGTLIDGKYEIVRLLGRGGMGQVYLALDVKLEREIALKTLAVEFSADAEHKARFMREARMASALNHPNILTIYEIGALGDVLFIATEYVKGKTLRQLMRNNELRLNGVIDIAVQAVQGLAAAHGAGIIHRDLKLENFILREDGYLKILDFGLAKESNRGHVTESDDDKFKTRAGIILGTPNYMSPEQAKGHPLDERSDIFSLGTVIYELITGHLAFDGDTDMQVLFNVAFKDPEPMPPSIPLMLQEVVRRAMQKTPDFRYRSMRLLLEDLLKVQHDMKGSESYRENDNAVNQDVAGEFRGRVTPIGISGRLTATTERISSVQLNTTALPNYERFVGRETELTALFNEYQRTTEGRPRPILLLGEAGSGRSQVINRFHKLLREHSVTIAAISCFEQSNSLLNPYQSLISLVAMALGFKDTESLNTDGEASKALNDHIRTQFGLELPLMLFQWQRESHTDADKWQIFEILRQIFFRLTQDRAVVVLVDNLHWANNFAIEFFGYLLRNLANTRLLFVATANEEEINKLGSALREWLLVQSRYIAFEQIKLKPFTVNEIQQLLESMFRRIEVPARELERLYDTTGGNPYYLVELIRLLVNDNKIAFSEGWWRCGSLEGIDLPTSIGITIQYKLERCKPETQEILQQAAVLGERFNFDLLAEVTEKDEDVLEKALIESSKAYLIREERGTRGDEFRFYNTTVRTVLYESLGKRQRRRQHLRVAQTIEELYRGKVSRFYGSLTYHYYAAGEWEKVIEFGYKSLEQANQQDAWREMEKYAQWIEEAVGIINESPSEYAPVNEELYAETRLKYCVALLRLGKLELAGERANEVLKIGQRCQNQRLVAQAKSRICELGWFQGFFAEAVRIGQEGLNLATQLDDVALQMQLHFHLGLCSWRIKPMSEALEHLQQASLLAQQVNDKRSLAISKGFYAMVLHCQGNWQRGRTELAEAFQIVKQTGDRVVESRLHTSKILLAFYEYRHADVEEIYREGLVLMRTVGWRVPEAYLHILQGYNYLLETNLDTSKSAEYLQRGQAICQETGEKSFYLVAKRGFAKVSMLQGDYQTAVTYLEELLKLFQSVGEVFEQTAVVCYLGEAWEMRGQVEKALEYFSRCQTIADMSQFAYWQWQALYGQGRCLQVLGKIREARQKLSAALAIIVKLRHEFDSEADAETFIRETQPVYDLLGSL